MSQKNRQRQERRKLAREHDHHLYVTDLEFYCENLHKTFHKEVFQTYTYFRCWCQLEHYEVLLGTGKGNVIANRIRTDGKIPLDPIIPDAQKYHEDHPLGLISYDGYRGSFLVRSQTLP